MENILKHAHSGWRWIVLILLIVAIAKAFGGWKGKKDFGAGDKKVFLFAMIAFHIQFLGGLILYFISPMVNFAEGFMKNPVFRFYSVEHLTMMGIAMILITIGYSKSKKAEGVDKFKKVAIFYTLTLIIVLASIPWPFRIETASWF